MTTFNHKLSRSSLRNREGACDELIDINNLALTICPIDFGIPQHGGGRIAQVQNKLYLKKASKCDGYIKISPHQLGDALDFYAYVNGKASWHHPHLMAVALAHIQAASILGHELDWGGYWMDDNPKIIDSIPYGWDCGHIQIVRR